MFDTNQPPSADLASDCVHCGFCLPACPTYALWGQEMDSPRGRIHLIKLGLEGEASLDKRFLGHFDACLGCMSCVTACPSGVQYEPLLEDTRAQLERLGPRSPSDRAFRTALLTLFGSRFLLRVAALGGWLYQRLRIGRLLSALGIKRRLSPRLAALEALLPEVSLRSAWSSMPEQIASQGPARLRVALLAGCVQSVFFRNVNLATARVLAAEGCEVIVPPEAECCGALAVHAGVPERAREQAKKLIVELESYELDHLVVNAAGCGATLKHYQRLFQDDPAWHERAAKLAAKTRDVLELLDQLEPRAERRPIAAKRIAYHDACHLAHAQGIRAAPRRVLQAIPDLELVEIPEAELCCGSAGIYNLTQPEPANELGRRKAENIQSLDIDTVAAANPGCLLQLRRYLPGHGETRLAHPIELIDESIG